MITIKKIILFSVIIISDSNIIIFHKNYLSKSHDSSLPFIPCLIREKTHHGLHLYKLTYIFVSTALFELITLFKLLKFLIVKHYYV